MAFYFIFQEIMPKYDQKAKLNVIFHKPLCQGGSAHILVN